VTLLVSRQATFEEVIQALVKKQSTIPSELYDRIRLFDVRGHKDYREFQLTQALSTASVDTSYGTNFFAEPIPLEEEEMSENDRFIIVVHFTKDISRLHGVPLKFVIKPVFFPHLSYRFLIW
jgi:ubiquitin carboxyl-terminal hydrolase 7